MLNIMALNEVLDDTCAKSIKDDLGVFFNRYKDCNEWFIASDYCIGAEGKKNDVIAFSIVPAVMDINILQHIIKCNLPKDIKNVRSISENGIKFMSETKFIFNIAFVIKGKSNIFKDPNISIKENVKDVIKHCIKDVAAKGASEDTLNKFRLLYEKSKSRNFNVSLFENVYLTSFLAAYVTKIICEQMKGSVNKFCWFPDRDAMRDLCDDIIVDMYNLNYHGLLYINKIDMEKTRNIGIAVSDKTKKNIWYDGLVRLPDYVAGTIASTEFPNMMVDKNKHITMWQKVMADNDNLGMVGIDIDNDCGVSAKRIKVSRKPLYTIADGF